MTDSDIAFEEPPRGREGAQRISHAIIAAQLRERQGQWALVNTKPSASKAAGLAYAIRNAVNLKHYRPAGAFEAVARSKRVTDPGGGKERTEYRCYARYVGEPT